MVSASHYSRTGPVSTAPVRQSIPRPGLAGQGRSRTSRSNDRPSGRSEILVHLLPALDEQDRLALPLAQVELLLASSVPEVELHPASGQSLTADYWVALLPEFDLAHVDLGVDAAMIGLTNRLWTVVAESLASARYDHETLPLLLRLWLAHEKGVLGRLVEDSARLWDWDYMEMCEAGGQVFSSRFEDCG